MPGRISIGQRFIKTATWTGIFLFAVVVLWCVCWFLGWTPQQQLSDAAYTGNLSKARLCLFLGAQLDDGGALINAANAHQTAMVEFLLQKGASPNVVVDSVYSNGDTLLIEDIAQRGDDEVFSLLLKHKALMHPTSLLFWAVDGGNPHIVKMLLDRGARVNARDYDGKTPLTLAIEHQHPQVAELLRWHGGKR